MSVVTEKCVRGSINAWIKDLKKPDRPVTILIHGDKQSLVVTRGGNSELLPISARVAEELIADGFSYGS